jgi:hypothetical protein
MKKNKNFLKPYLLIRKKKAILANRSLYSLTFGQWPRWVRS